MYICVLNYIATNIHYISYAMSQMVITEIVNETSNIIIAVDLFLLEQCNKVCYTRNFATQQNVLCLAYER